MGRDMISFWKACFQAGMPFSFIQRNEKKSRRFSSWVFHQKIDKVDGSEILRSPVEVGSLSEYWQGFIHPNAGWDWDFFHEHFPPCQVEKPWCFLKKNGGWIKMVSFQSFKLKIYIRILGQPLKLEGNIHKSQRVVHFQPTLPVERWWDVVRPEIEFWRCSFRPRSKKSGLRCIRSMW